MGLFEIYLAGWLLVSGIGVVKECKEPSRVMSHGECVTMYALTGAAWPVIVPIGVYQKLKAE